MIIAASAKIPISRGGSTRNEDDLMTKPWTSFQVFGSGMLLAFFYFEYRSQEVYESLRTSLGTSFLNLMKRLPSFIHFIFMILCAVCYVLLYISTQNYYTQDECFYFTTNCWESKPLATVMYHTFSRLFLVVTNLLLIIPLLVGKLGFL